jgi:lipoprotein-releasing system ATP-binding protein
MASPILKARGLHKAFHYPAEVQILRGVSLDIYAGDSIAITGASGQGKSTLLQILGTLEYADQGDLHIAGQLANKRSASGLRCQEIGFVFQNFHLLADYSVIDNVLMPARIAREPTHPGSRAYERAEELLLRVGLEERSQFSTKLLSGGEKQRVSIARAFCNSPKLLLADEPTGNLDEGTADHIHALLFDFLKQGPNALVIVTHHPGLASLCSRHLHLKDGVLHEVSPGKQP